MTNGSTEGQMKTVANRTKPVKAYQLKVTLLESDPPIWRRFVVPGQFTLNRLHDTLQVVMGWTDSHLHQFEIDGQWYGAPAIDEVMGEIDVEDDSKVTLQELITRPGGVFLYSYDFGDGWDHAIEVERITPADPKLRHPVCLEGARHCPPENCGGVYGYEDFLEAIRDPTHEQHEELLAWIGGHFDPEEFDVHEVNRQVKH